MGTIKGHRIITPQSELLDLVTHNLNKASLRKNKDIETKLQQLFNNSKRQHGHAPKIVFFDLRLSLTLTNGSLCKMVDQY